MKYEQPIKGDYTSNLTTELMYKTMSVMYDRYITFEDYKRVRDTPGFNIGKLWDNPTIRRETTDFINSYFFSDLNEASPGFRELFTNKGVNITEGLKNYSIQLKNHLGTEDKANNELKRLFRHLRGRLDKYSKARDNIINYEGNEIIKKNAADCFRLLSSSIDGRIQLAMMDLE